MILAVARTGFIEGLPEALDCDFIARHLGVTTRTVRKWRTRGIPVGGHRVYLPDIKAGERLIRVARKDYIEFLRQTNPDVWMDVAEQQDAERRQAKRDHKRSRRGK